MKTRLNFALVGLFVLTLSAAMIAGLLWLGAGGPKPAHRTYLTYMTESVYGLSKDSAVTYRGVTVGRVRNIDLDPANSERARLLLEIRADTPIKENTFATLETQGLTGLAHVNLEGGDSPAPPLQAKPGEIHPVIPSRPSLLGRWDESVSLLLANLTETTERINRLLNDRHLEQISGTLSNLHTLSSTLAEESSHIQEIVHQLQATLNNSREASSRLGDILEDVDRDVAARLPELVEQLRVSAASVEHMAAQIATTGGAVEQVVRNSGSDLERFTAQSLPEATTLVMELRQTAQNLRRFSEDLERHPEMLLRGAPQPRPGPGE